MNISKEQFEAYEAVRVSGVTNMFDIDYVCELSGLERKDVIVIMSSYKELYDKYIEKR